MQNPVSGWCSLYLRSVSPHSVSCQCKMGQSSVRTALFNRVAGGTPKRHKHSIRGKLPKVLLLHTQHLGLKSIPTPSVFHPLPNWMLTTTIHRHHFANVTDENTEACFSRIQRLFPRITQPVRGWQRGSSKTGISGLEVHHAIPHRFPNSKREGRRKGSGEIDFIMYQSISTSAFSFTK